MSGKFNYDFSSLNLQGEELTISNPVFGRVKANLLTGNFQYLDGAISLNNVRLEQGKSQYQLDATWKNSQISANVGVVKGDIQNLLTALEIFELEDLGRNLGDRDYAKSRDLYREGDDSKYLFSATLPQTGVLQQIERITEIQNLLIQNEKLRQENALFPELVDLQGDFDGNIAISGSLTKGLAANFNFQGQDWQWANYKANQFLVEGSYQDGILTLAPISIQFDNSQLSFSGSFGGPSLSGQVKLANLPVTLLQEFVKFPDAIDFDGSLDGSVTISGTKNNPQIKGSVEVNSASINQTSLQSTLGSFNYENARLDFFASSAIVDNSQPLEIKGSIPYQLSFANVTPESDRLNLNLQVRDRGLTLLNILTKNAVQWQDGQGEVNLNIDGYFNAKEGRPKQITALGTASVENATIGVQILPDAPLTQVNGKINFDFDHIDVENLQGNFGGGTVAIDGTLPLNKATPQEDPLSAIFNNLNIKLKGLYEGGVRGQVDITGSALQPNLGGQLELFDGTVLLGETSEGEDKGEGNDGEGGIVAATQFNNLKLTLGNNIQISKPPILSFIADGSLDVFGTINKPRPQGTISLKRGQVNLFTTQLYLAGDAENTAKFYRDRALDPYLNVRLLGSVVETNRTIIGTDPISADVNDIPASNLGSLQTVRVRAQVDGYASQLTDSIELTSSPPRNQTEIIALLGGSFVDTLGRGDSTLGLANLAGSALLGSFNNAVGEALGLSEFRLFPTQVNDKKEKNAVLGLAAEASIDLTNIFSFSVLKVLNTEVPAQYGIRYRINENTVLRGSSNFDDDSRIILEYQNRF